MGAQRPGGANGRGTDADFLANSIVSKRHDVPHKCGHCMTPMGRSALPCKNDRNRSPR